MRSAKNFPPAQRWLQILFLSISVAGLFASARAQNSEPAGSGKSGTEGVKFAVQSYSTTAFTYQGRLADANGAANGLYDLQFKLFDSETAGTQFPPAQPITVVLSNVAVTGGVFTALVDFGPAVFDGNPRYLEIGVRPANGQSFTTLAPRQPITSTPYAIRSLTASSADHATNAAQLNGVNSSQYVLTTDTRLSDARQPTAGSTDYIQNGPQTQSGASFNIDGSGTLGGTLSAATVNSTGSYNINSVPVLRVSSFNTSVGAAAGSVNSGGANSFFGYGAGAANTSGILNSFYGATAGAANTTGYANAFFGREAGRSNTTGDSNSFYGESAGNLTTQGSSNSFFGRYSGGGNTTGAANSYFGYQAGLSGKTVTYNSFFGYNAGQANNASGGSFFGTNAGQTNNNGDQNSFFGFNTGASNTAGSYNTFFGAYAGYSNTIANANAFFGHSAGRSNTIGTNNSFFGNGSGSSNTEGSDNSFFGKDTGKNNTASFNSFFGSLSGSANTTGGGNSFFGVSAGLKNTTGGNNNFFGAFSGSSNTTGSSNAFFGSSAGQSNQTGAGNTFFGYVAGKKNTGGIENVFVGSGSGINNLTGNQNTFIGTNAGTITTVENLNTLIGHSTNAAAGVSGSTAIGWATFVSQSNSLVFGSGSDRVGLGVSAPKEKLDIDGGNVNLRAAGSGVILKSPNGAVCRLLTIDNAGAMVLTPVTCP